MKGETHFGKDENLPLRYAYFHVHFNIILKKNLANPCYQHKVFHWWVTPSKETVSPESILEDSWDLMIINENVWIFTANENYSWIFPWRSN